MTYWRCGPGLLPLTLIRMAVSVMHHHTPPQLQSALGRAVCVSAHSSWHSGARMLRAALPREIKPQLPPAASGLGASVAVLAPAACSLSLAGRTVGSLPVPQTGAVSEAVPSTVFHQRLDPADNCSVLYPEGDNQGRTILLKVAPAEIHTSLTLCVVCTV